MTSERVLNHFTRNEKQTLTEPDQALMVARLLCPMVEGGANCGRAVEIRVGSKRSWKADFGAGPASYCARLYRRA